jgi:NAD(P)-dependent dehydrogenase (short-subunit alcohol dehydrogenase family)
VLDINVVGIARVSQAALPHLRKSASAAIVNTCSIVAWAGLPARALYSASKDAALSLTLAMATDHLADRTRVNCGCPGTADTWVGRLLDSAPDPPNAPHSPHASRWAGWSRRAKNTIVYLASPPSTSTTGTALAVDGGMYGQRLDA